MSKNVIALLAALLHSGCIFGGGGTNGAFPDSGKNNAATNNTTSNNAMSNNSTSNNATSNNATSNNAMSNNMTSTNNSTSPACPGAFDVICNSPFTCSLDDTGPCADCGSCDRAFECVPRNSEQAAIGLCLGQDVHWEDNPGENGLAGTDLEALDDLLFVTRPAFPADGGEILVTMQDGLDTQGRLSLNRAGAVGRGLAATRGPMAEAYVAAHCPTCGDFGEIPIWTFSGTPVGGLDPSFVAGAPAGVTVGDSLAFVTPGLGERYHLVASRVGGGGVLSIKRLMSGGPSVAPVDNNVPGFGKAVAAARTHVVVLSHSQVDLIHGDTTLQPTAGSLVGPIGGNEISLTGELAVAPDGSMIGVVANGLLTVFRRGNADSWQKLEREPPQDTFWVSVAVAPPLVFAGTAGGDVKVLLDLGVDLQDLATLSFGSAPVLEVGAGGLFVGLPEEGPGQVQRVNIQR